MTVNVAKKKGGPRKPKPGQMKDANGRATVEGKQRARQLAFPKMEKLDPRKEIVEVLMQSLGLSEHNAGKLYDELEHEFGSQFKKPAKSQLDYARYRALQEIMNGEDINASQRLAAAKELGKLIDDGSDSPDDETRCRHYESMWKRVIDAAARMGVNELQKVYDRIEDMDWQLFHISEQEVVNWEEKAESLKNNARSGKRGK